jgi:hypothetical protein
MVRNKHKGYRIKLSVIPIEKHNTIEITIAIG